MMGTDMATDAVNEERGLEKGGMRRSSVGKADVPFQSYWFGHPSSDSRFWVGRQRPDDGVFS